MATTSKIAPRDVYYYRQRFKNRVFSKIARFFSEEAERDGVTKRVIAERLGRDPAQITRWLSQPGNLTLETISDLLLAMDAEPEPPVIVRFEDRAAPNYAHPLVARVIGVHQAPLVQPIIRLDSGLTTTISNATQVRLEGVL